jgi:small-conductance mechanosensitive channel
MALPRGVPYALSSLTRYALFVVGFLLALVTLGLDLTHITVLVSAVGVGLGFGLQQVVANFVAGLLLLFERPLQVGDAVQIGELVGEVERIGLRASTLRTPEGAEVIVPNSRLVDHEITNWTLSDRKRRVDVEVSVAEHADPGPLLALLVDVARRDPRVVPEPEPEALVVRFAEDATEFQLRFWTEDVHWMRLRSDVGLAVQQALRQRRRGAA